MSERRIGVWLTSSGTRSMTVEELESAVREARKDPLPGVELRCPKPRYRWKIGTPGPCGRVLGRMFATREGASIEILAPVEQIGETGPPWRWKILKEPSGGRFVETPTVDGVQADLMLREPGSGYQATGGTTISFEVWKAKDVYLECPRCGAESDLPTLTGRRLMT